MDKLLVEAQRVQTDPPEGMERNELPFDETLPEDANAKDVFEEFRDMAPNSNVGLTVFSPKPVDRPLL